MRSETPKAQAIRYWWTKATQSLSATRRELAAGDYALAVNRAYYALFYAVSALLLEEGHKFTKHSGVRAAFNRDIIKPGDSPNIMENCIIASFGTARRVTTSPLPSLTTPMSRNNCKAAKPSLRTFVPC
jgi:uncharacterized protein (UPF0332 family)